MVPGIVAVAPILWRHPMPRSGYKACGAATLRNNEMTRNDANAGEHEGFAPRTYFFKPPNPSRPLTMCPIGPKGCSNKGQAQ